MTRDEQRLLRHLVIAVLVKLVVLGALWWLFVHPAHAPADADMSAAWMASTKAPQGASQ